MEIGATGPPVGLEEVHLERDGALLLRWLRNPHVARWWGEAEEVLREIMRRPMDTHALITLEGRPVGYLCWQTPPREELEQARLTDLPEGLVDIDILIGEPGCLGLGVGPRALTALLGRLRGEAVPFAGVATSTANHRALRAFEKAGFVFFRDFEDPDGPYRYMVARLADEAEPPAATDGAARRP